MQMKVSKGQGSIEALIIVVVGVIVLTAIISIVSNTFSGMQATTKSQSARNALDHFSALGFSLNSQGVGAKAEVIMSLPADIDSATFSGKTITVRSSNGQIFTRSVEFNVYGSVNLSEGKNYIKAQALNNGVCFGNPTYCATCGDGIISGIEQCEIGSLNGNTCVSLGYARGNLSCLNSCQYNTSQCIPSICGNNLTETGEVCDGTDLSGQTCRTQGSWLGNLRCLPNCQGFNMSGCVPAQSMCLAINISSVTLDAAENRIHGIVAKNLCNYSIFVTGANISWTNPSNLLETVQIDGSVKWSYNCNWGCTPSGKQPSNTNVYFSGTNTLLFTMPPYSSNTFDKVDWKNSVEDETITLRFILNDSSLNTSIPFTVDDD